ncbi:MAG: lipoyl(octanoyl) transferase LipB [bacterium]|nr:lipoyl(octanoyl) transferase LipB [bacterium]
MPGINVIPLGTIDYDSALALQLKERELVAGSKSPGSIFILEHDPPVITLGRHAAPEHLLHPEPELEQDGYQIRRASRGGDVTLHEPGQVVIYFILPVQSKAVNKIVEPIMRFMESFLKQEFALAAVYDGKRPGLWVENRKLCFTGFDLTGRASMHGIAINVSNPVESFDRIIPCGMEGISITSLNRELPCAISSIDMALSLKKALKKLNFACARALK